MRGLLVMAIAAGVNAVICDVLDVELIAAAKTAELQAAKPGIQSQLAQINSR